jgi:hypothetical protein
MTNQPSVRPLPEFCPPTELIRNWETMYKQAGNNPDAVLRNVAWETAQWGADQQLTKDATWLDHNSLDTPHLKITPIGKTLIEAMRPKLPSLKELALQRCDQLEKLDILNEELLGILRSALEELPND